MQVTIIIDATLDLIHTRWVSKVASDASVKIGMYLPTSVKISTIQ